MFSDLSRQAFNALKHNRRRSMLTMLGMAWGIATVVLLLAYGSGFQNALMVAFRTFGGNLIGILKSRGRAASARHVIRSQPGSGRKRSP